MKFVVLFTSLIALCAGGAVPLIPGDNTGYVEGISRYIWMPDGHEVPHLVDLMEPVDQSVLDSRDGSNNEYWLYTRDNLENHQILVKDDINSVRNSFYIPSRPTKVIAHGWNNEGTSDVNTLVKNAFLAVQDCNVIVVDWHALSNSNYITATHGVPSVGEYLGDFLVWLIFETGASWDDVHLIGHSLGAHVVGNAGRRAGGRARRVTGLDPAGPLWIGNSHALDTDAGLFLEAIHTDGGALGIFHSVGDVDFYPNGGTNPQPGCLISTCSHSRSYHLFAASIRYNHFEGRQCSSMLQVSFNHCSGSTLKMGNGNLSKTGKGIFRVNTDDVWPF